MQKICVYFLLFFTYAVIGWCLEVSCKLIGDHKFVNRGFLIGPYCPIYGYGVLLMTLLLTKYMNDPFIIFILNIVICSILEYATSYFLEKIYHTRWWDYTKYRFNINGRICLETMIPFGLGGLIVMYVVNPFFFKLYYSIPLKLLFIISGILFTIMLIDNIVSSKIMNNIKNISKETQRKQIIMRDDTERITLLVRKQIENSKKKFTKRVLESFPHLEMLKINNLKDNKKR